MHHSIETIKWWGGGCVLVVGWGGGGGGGGLEDIVETKSWGKKMQRCCGSCAAVYT